MFTYFLSKKTGLNVGASSIVKTLFVGDHLVILVLNDKGIITKSP